MSEKFAGYVHGCKLFEVMNENGDIEYEVITPSGERKRCSTEDEAIAFALNDYNTRLYSGSSPSL